MEIHAWCEKAFMLITDVDWVTDGDTGFFLRTQI